MTTRKIPYLRCIGFGITLLQLLAAPSLLGAQPTGNSTEVDRLLQEADRLEWLDNHAAAAPLYRQAEQLSATNGDRKQEAHARIGRIRAESLSHSFLEASAQLAAELDGTIVENDPQLRLRCLASKGYIDLEIDPVAAHKDWEEALPLAQQSKDPAWEARATGELGVLSFLNGDGTQAVRLVGKALFSMQASGDVAGQIRLLSITGLGMVDIGRPEEAMGYFDQALSLAGKTPDIGFPFMALEGKAELLANEGKTADAERLLRQALDQAQQLERRANQADILILLGKMAEKKDPDAAIGYLEQAATIAESSQFFRIEAEAMLELSALYRAKNQLDAADRLLTRGVEASRRVGDTHYLPRDLTALADLRVAQGKFGEADALYEQAVDVLDAIMVNAANSYVKSSYIGAMSYVYTHHFALMAEQHDVERAFAIVERARARSLADILSAQDWGDAVPAVGPKDREISELQLQLLRSQKPTERRELLDSLFRAEEERFFSGETSRGPHLSTHPVELAKFQHSLNPDEAVFEFVLSEPAAYCIVVTRDKTELVSLPNPKKEIQSTIKTYLRKVKAKEDTTAEEHDLFQTLLGTAEAVHKIKWIIVPDGALHLLPFEALRGASNDFVLDAHEITYAPSSTALYLIRSEERPQAAMRPFLGVGDVAYESLRDPQVKSTSLLAADLNVAAARTQRGMETLSGPSLEKLPGTRAEVESGAHLFGSYAITLLGTDATESAFKSQRLSEFRVIHLATHAVSDAKFPERAALVLGRAASSEEDGLLQVPEITGLHLKADLVTLSACDTGVGKLEGEEGVADLERAFLFAGARAVVASLWSADDVFTRALMKQFYSHLSRGMEKGAALRQAKLDLIDRYGKHVPPYYWAPFVISGDSSSSLGSWKK